MSTSNIFDGNTEGAQDSTTATTTFHPQRVIEISPFLGDTTQNPTTLAALGSIHRAWTEAYHAPLAVDKEERIRQAVDFMKTEEDAHTSDRTIKKHSYRQVALYFKIPKSTLYDRLKQRNNNNTNVTATPSKRRSEDSQNSADENELTLRTTISEDSRHKPYEKQMKLTPQREKELIVKVGRICHAMGNVMNRTQIKSYIKSYVNEISLGKKWLMNFMNRHKGSVLYGSPASAYNVNVSTLKNGKNNFPYLWKCYVHLLQNTVKSLPRKKPFYYITRTCFDHQSRSSIFTCFEISPVDYEIKLHSSPEGIIFPDFFQNKVHLNLLDSNSSGFNLSDNSSMLMKSKNNKLSKLLLKVYMNCAGNDVQLADANSDLPFIIFEGFDESFNWEPSTCEQVITTSKFLSVPWKESVFQRILYPMYVQAMQDYVQSLIVRETTSVPLFFTLDEVDIELPTLSKIFIELMDKKLGDLAVNNTSRHNEGQQSDMYLVHNLGQNEEDDVNEDVLKATPPTLHSGQFCNSTTITPLQGTSSNVFEHSMMTQLNDIIDLIDTKENVLRQQIQDPSTKETLSDIFNRIRNIVPQ
ncbi:hypothetical protein KAFR_0F02930 [Kazachstania africana CBS 2517]|uniref:Uncharacterized protein n=1 Tax=Kazachstania africana (strain ATCC 22294 / BCRC 22015 / CBS 2517 / CECT 1963 / NBRC 1671 / NRRL Y-8276) TaxID=1071382 RepID=H2AWY9_KAZAF|nr:hypothetical protein KAFR_0F02930 [Kazachstania africana CBS 2517]CCF58889.1 hypothetical protein KAFR_0F02930 [Kazachstania africana CBS 2517]